jgi:hypothetical protein
MSWLFGALGVGVLFIIWFVAGLAGKSARLRQTEQELEEWEGVMDVKREARDKLNDPDYVKRMQNEFND